MRIVFWQNCLSPHQLPYIVHLLEDERVDEVVVCAGEAINRTRKDMGWDTTSYPGLENCDVYLVPTPQTVEHLMQVRTEDSYHLFSGIRGFAFVFDAFLRSLAYPLKRGMITERPNTYAYGRANGKPLWLHRLRWKLQDRKFMPKVNCVFAMGTDASDFYRTLHEGWKVFPFGYCTEGHQIERKPDGSTIITHPLRVAYVGGLLWWKSVDTLLISTIITQKMSSGNEIELTLIGDGPERAKLEAIVNKNQLNNVRFLGSQKQSEIPRLLAYHDVLVLPSIYDGWGAVVNEGLQAGLFTICSDACGAKDLLHDPRCGAVFRTGDVKQLTKVLSYCRDHVESIRGDKQYRMDWADKAISGKAVARYMVDCLCNVKTERPWIQE